MAVALGGIFLFALYFLAIHSKIFFNYLIREDEC